VVKEELVGAWLSRIRGVGSCVKIVEILIGVGRDDGLACLSGHNGEELHFMSTFHLEKTYIEPVITYLFTPLCAPFPITFKDASNGLSAALTSF